MREWSVKCGKKRVENPPVGYHVYEQVFIRQAWCTDRPHSFWVGGRNLFENSPKNRKRVN